MHEGVRGRLRTERVRSGHLIRGQVDALHISPEGERPNTPPILIVPGFSADENPNNFKYVAEKLVGRIKNTAVDVVAFRGLFPLGRLSRAARKREIKEGMGIQKPETGEPAIISFNKAAALLGYMDQQNISQAYLVAHSLGAQAALFAYAMAPERFIKVALVAPAIRDEYPVTEPLRRTFKQQSAREGQVARENPETREVAIGRRRRALAALGTHMVRLWHEIQTIKQTDMRDFVKAKADGKIFVFAGDNDKVFGKGKIDSSLPNLQFYQGGHNDIFYGNEELLQAITGVFELNTN